MLPQPNGPSHDKVLHDEHVRDDALIVSEREAAYQGEHGAVQRVNIGVQSCEPRGSVCICVQVVVFTTATIDVQVQVGAHGQCATSDVVFESMSVHARGPGLGGGDRRGRDGGG